MKHNSFTSRFSIHPVIQAPMAGVSTPALAAAVSNAGALGSIALGASHVEQAEKLIVQTKKLTTHPFNVNLFCHQPPTRNDLTEQRWLEFVSPLFKPFGSTPPVALHERYQSCHTHTEMLLLLLKHKPQVISFHFGLPPTEWIETLSEAGLFLIASATSLQEAKHIEQAGIHGIVAQGIEAGGHRGNFDPSQQDDQQTTADLVRLLSANTTLPIIAAGGIMNGQEIKRMMELGASAAQLGTAFITCPESAATERYRDRLLNGDNHETTLTRGISGRAARGLCNLLTAYLDADHAPSIPDYPLAYDVAKQLSQVAQEQGCDDYTAYWAGQKFSAVRQLTAKQLTEALVWEMQTSQEAE